MNRTKNAARAGLVLLLAGLLFSQLALAQWNVLNAPGQSTLATAKSPTVLAVARNARLVAVGTENNKSIAFYHPDTGAALGSVGLPKAPLAVALSDDGSKAYALYDDKISIAAISTASRAITATWRLDGAPVGMVLDSARGQLLVAERGSKRILGISTATGTVVRTAMLQKNPELIGLGGGNAVLVGLEKGELLVLDGATLNTVRSVALGDELRALAWWDSAGRALAVAKNRDALAIVEPATGSVTRVPLTVDPLRLDVEQSEDWAYVGAKDDKIVSLVDLVRRVLAGYFTVPGKVGSLAFDQQGGLLFVTLGQDDQLLKLDPAQASLLSTIRVQKTLKDVAVNNASHEAVAVSDKDPDVARVKLADRSVTVLKLQEKALKVAIDPRLNVAVIGDNGQKVLFVDLGAAQPVAYPERIVLDGPVSAIAIDATRAIAVVLAKGEKRARLIDIRSRSQIAAVSLPAEADGVAVHSGKGVAYIATADKQLRVLDLATRTLGSVVALDFKVVDIAVDEALDLAVLVTNDVDKAHLLDLDSLRTAASVSVPKNPVAVAVQPDTHIAVIASRNDDALSLIDLATRTVTPNFNRLDRPTALAITTRFNQALVVSADKDDLVLVQLANPVPTLSAITPSNAFVGGADATVTLTGTGFVDGAIVFAGTTELATTWLAGDRLSVVIPAAMLAQLATLQLRVHNAGPKGGDSNSLSFAVVQPPPVLDSVAPEQVLADGQPKAFTLTGSQFVAPATVIVGTQEFAASVTGPTSASVTVPGSAFGAAGTLSFAIRTIGGTSAARTVTITQPAPSPFLYSSSPATTLALGQPVPVVLSGANFVSGAVVLVGTETLSASFTNSQQLRATIPGTLTAQPGTLLLSVRNPDGGLSNGYQFPVTAPDLVIASIAPVQGPVGTALTIYGTGFSANAADNRVTFAGGVQATVTFATSTELHVNVPAGAQSGAVAVSVGSRSVDGPAFTVGTTPSEDFAFGANASDVVVYQGSSASVDVRLDSAGTTSYANLARLSVTGLPSGVTASFTRPYLTGGLTASLVLTADASAAVGQATLTITAAGDTSAGSSNRTATLRVDVRARAGVTGVKGRFVDGKGVGIGGVLVRHETTQVQSDSAGNFLLTGLPASTPITLRFDATPAHPLYPIWPYTIILEQGQLATIPDWTIPAPPADDKFKPITESPQPQEIVDERFPGLKITIPANTSIVGWDGVKKTRIAVERHDPDKSPTAAPPIPTRSVYQLYFGTPMGGIPTQPIPVTLPNETDLEPGEQTEVWYFDGSPMGGDGKWKVAGTATVSADGKTIAMNPGQGIPRFCGVCGLLCVKDRNPAPPPPPPPPCHPGDGGGGGGGGGGGAEPPQCKAGNPVQLSNGQEMPVARDFVLAGAVPLALSRYYNTADPFNNRAGTVGSFGYGWGFEYDVVLLPFEGVEKRIVMPGNLKVSFVQQADGTYRNSDNYRFQGAIMRPLAGTDWEVVLADQTRWTFKTFPGITGNIRGGSPTFLVEERKPNGKVLSIGRLPNGRVTSIGTAERQVTMTYGAEGFVSEVSDPLGRKVRYTYAASGRIATVTNPEGGVTRYEYGSFQGDYPLAVPPVSGNDPVCVQAFNDSFSTDLGLPIKSIQYPGTTGKTVNTLGHGGRVLRQVLADGSEFRFRYTIVGGCRAARPGVAFPMTTCSALNDSCEQSYERAERGEHVFGGSIAAVTVVDPKGRMSTVRFSPTGAASGQANEQGQPATYKRDSVGRIVESTDVLGRTMKYTYDGAGNVTRTIDSLGRVTDMTYDPRWNRLATVTAYLDDGTPVTRTNTYDPVTGNLTRAANPEGNARTFEYNARGQVTKTTDALSHAMRFEYNAAGDLVKVIDPLQHEVLLEPDLAGRTTKITDPMQFATRIERNGLDQATKVIDANLGETRMSYNAKHLVASITDPLDHVVETYDYDDMYRPTRRTDAVGKSEAIRYDAVGNAEQHTDRKNQVTSQTFDESDRPLVMTFADGSRIERRYDAVGRVVKLIRSGAGLDETFTYELDNADRVTQLTRLSGSRTDIVTYRYDTLNRVVSRTVNGEVTAYSYDKAGRVLSIQHKGQVTRYTWDAASRLTQKTLPNGVKQQMVYDDANKVTSLIYRSAADAIIEQIDYQYDDRGLRTSMTTLGAYPIARDTPIAATYDTANRLTVLTLKGGAGGPATDETYALTYDDNGNLVEKRGQGAAAGNVTTYAWDKQNRLTGITQTGTAGTVAASFGYDQFGRRVSKTVNGNEVKYVYDGEQAVGEEVSGATTSQLTGVSIDEHIARYTAQDQLVYLSDALGSIIAQTRADGAFQNRYGYSPYGQVAVDGDDKGNPHQYTGRENDGTGLYYYRARYYMPTCGRFISEDPAGIHGGANFYAYASGNPVMNNDPSGLWSPEAHDAILRHLYGGCLTQDSVNDLMRGSRSVDGDGLARSAGILLTGDPAEHAMRNPGESLVAARTRMQNFIDRELELARQNPRDAFYHYGRALHPIMDSTSPLHEGFQEWSMNKHPFDSGQHGNRGEGPAQLTPDRLRQNERAVRTYAPNLNDLCKAY